jgi:hypothetical protein
LLTGALGDRVGEGEGVGDGVGVADDRGVSALPRRGAAALGSVVSCAIAEKSLPACGCWNSTQLGLGG